VGGAWTQLLRLDGVDWTPIPNSEHRTVLGAIENFDSGLLVAGLDGLVGFYRSDLGLCPMQQLILSEELHHIVVDGDVAYPSLSDLPEAPTIVNLVVPADQTMAVLREAEELGWHNVWVQPGAESNEVLAYLEAGPFTYLANACIMTRSRHRSAV